jgi:hypothetical protein
METSLKAIQVVKEYRLELDAFAGSTLRVELWTV